MISNLKDNDNNPYVLYTIINIYKQLLILYSHLYESDKIILFNLIEYNNQKIKLKSINQLSELANNLLYKFPKFTKALFLKAELNDMEGKDNEEIYKYLIK